jgi:hypothetical protein
MSVADVGRRGEEGSMQPRVAAPKPQRPHPGYESSSGLNHFQSDGECSKRLHEILISTNTHCLMGKAHHAGD